MSAPEGFTEVISQKAIELLARGNEATHGRLAQLLHDFVTPTFRAVDHWAQFGLLPVCLALLILHENHRAVTDGGVFRLGHVLGRTVAIVALVLCYDKVCGLITGVAGAGGGWMSGDQYLDHVGHSNDSLGDAWDNIVADDSWTGVDWGNLPKFLAVLFIWVIVMITALFAYVAGLLLSMAQAVLLTIIAAVGKTCIIVSLVPGVGIGKSWARSLAQVAAWSTIAGVITALVLAGSGDIQALVASGDLLGLLKSAAEFVIVGVCTLAVPAITTRIMAGGGQVAVGVAGALAMGYAGAKMAASGIVGRGAGAGQGSRRPDRDAAGDGEGQGGGDRGGGRRAHKAPRDMPPAPARRFSAAIAPAASAEARRQPADRDRAAALPVPAEPPTKERTPAPVENSSARDAAAAHEASQKHGSGSQDEARTSPWAGRAPRASLAPVPASGAEPITRPRRIRSDGGAQPAVPRRPEAGSPSAGGPARAAEARPSYAPPLSTGNGSAPVPPTSGAADRPRSAATSGGGRPDEHRTEHPVAPRAGHDSSDGSRQRSAGRDSAVAGEIDARPTAAKAPARVSDAAPARAHDTSVDRPRRVPSPNVIRRQPRPPQEEKPPPAKRREARPGREEDTQP